MIFKRFKLIFVIEKQILSVHKLYLTCIVVYFFFLNEFILFHENVAFITKIHPKKGPNEVAGKV